MFRIAFFALLLLCFVSVNEVEAATLYFDPAEATIYSGDTIVVAVRVNTDTDECINAIDGVIEYDSSITPVDISRGQSIFPLWVEEPKIDKVNNKITFAAGIPNGYCGRVQGDPRLTNEVLKIVFQVPGLTVGAKSDTPTTTVFFTDQTKVYLNDGEGSLASLLTLESQIYVNDYPGSSQINEWIESVRADDIPPQQFSIDLEYGETAFPGQYYIVFNTTDKQTGIASYEIMEEPLSEALAFKWGRTDAPWIEARSPYVLKDQSLNSTIRVKAIDKSGNEYIAVLVPDENMRKTSFDKVVLYSVFGVSLVVVIVLSFAAFLHVRRRKISRKIF